MSDTIIFTFGRMTPPTKSHILLIQKVMELSTELNADHKVYISQKYKPITDPLKWAFKKTIIRTCLPKVNISTDVKIKTPFQALEYFANNGYKKVIMVVGGDRINEFNNKMSPYAKKWGIKDFKVISIGERDSSEGIEGLSASKLREYALNSNKKEFFNGLPDMLDNNWKGKIFHRVRINMK